MSSNPSGTAKESDSRHRLKVSVRGAVQGVGFRPFVFRLATELGLTGWVNNSSQGVFIEVEGDRGALESFLLRLEQEKPPRSSIQSLEAAWLDPAGFKEFVIRPSLESGAKTALILPDIATCEDCRREIFDPKDRRFFYPFTNCTNCGPRFSIIESLPYDRQNTSMKRFRMCPLCQAEYDDPLNRRFHAQPNACPACGPHLELWDEAGNARSTASSGARAALEAAAEEIRAGKILAVKGLGGFHLVVAAHDPSAVQRLRERKHREEKPLALMFPSLDPVKAVCRVSPIEKRLLCSPESPIVLLQRFKAEELSPKAPPIVASIAPGNPNLGVLLPYTPLHHLLLSLLQFPVVATSGNLSDEPICIDEHEAVERLHGIADAFLVHNRPIVRHVDDSLVRIIAGREMMLRRARGYAPLPVTASNLEHAASPTLAVGAHLKNTVALSGGSSVFLSQHIGDLETDQAFEAFRRVIADFQKLYELTPAVVAADAHPDYLSSQFARGLSTQGATVPGTPPPRLVLVQHHLAHVLSCMAENELDPPLLGVAWDGTGYGLDGTVWGGEFFLVTDTGWRRCAHWRSFPLPGGDQAIKEPRRSALGLLFAALGETAFEKHELSPLGSFSPTELSTVRTMLLRRLNSPMTSSVGRLFDAVSALAGLRQRVAHEGQAAMELEFALPEPPGTEAYPVGITGLEAAEGVVLDWAPLVQALLEDLRQGVAPGVISARFHNALVEGLVSVARHFGQSRVLLSGGCFQNRYLSERAIGLLEQAGFRPYWHQRVPPNDGGIALGQVFGAALEKLTRSALARDTRSF